MASVIKAGNATDGVQVTSDNTGILELKTGTGAGTTAMTIGTDQSVTFAGAVSSSGNQTVTGNLTVTGSGSIQGLTVGRGAGNVATNTAVGASALAATTGSSSNNTALGSAAGSSLTSGARNTALGFNALLLNTTGAENTAVGGNALNKSTTASNNTALGYVALYETTTGANNTALGAQALQNNTTASNNTAVGYQALYSSNRTADTAAGNVALGYQAGYTASTSQYGTFVGIQAGYSVTTGSNNTFVGQSAGYFISTGAKNTILGAYNGNQGGLDIRTASNYIVLSDGDGNPRVYVNDNGQVFFGVGSNNSDGYLYLQGRAASGYGPILIGRTGAIGSTTDQWLIGSNSNIKGGTTYSTLTCTAGGATGGVNLTSGATSWASASDARLKNVTGTYTNPLADIAQIEAVKFTWKADESAKPCVGVIAQSVEAVVPEAIETVRVSKDDETDYLSVRYTELIPLMIASIQELKAEIDALKGQP